MLATVIVVGWLAVHFIPGTLFWRKGRDDA